MSGSHDLRADCARCAALCCVAPAFAKSADFAVDKPAETPCRHLAPDFGCGIHDTLRDRGFPGCTVYDCFGAGQQVVQITFGGRDHRDSPEQARRMFAVFPTMRVLHELRWYLTEASTFEVSAALRAELAAALAETERLAEGTADELVAFDATEHRAACAGLLRRAGAQVRGTGGSDRSGASLLGADLRGTDLRAADLRGSLLIGADLRGVDLRGADLLGADLRGADLRGADLREVLFCVQSQLDAARGDDSTVLPGALTRPAHWAPPPPPRRSTRTRAPRRR